MQPDYNQSFWGAFLLSVLIFIVVTPAEAAYPGNLSNSRTFSAFNGNPILMVTAHQPAALGKTEAEPSSNASLLHQLRDDMAYLLTEPDFYVVTASIGFAPSIFRPAFNRESSEFKNLWGSSVFADHFFKAGGYIGNNAFLAAGALTVWGVGKATESSRLAEFGSDLIRVEAVNGILTLVLKTSINRTRPNGERYSYPSGHTSAAFAVAGVVFTDYGKAWGIPALVLAGYVGLSRLQEGKHYPSDVIAGGILGTYVSLKVVQHRKAKEKISVSPLIAGDIVGLSLGLRI